MLVYNYNSFLNEADDKEKKKIPFFLSETLAILLQRIKSPITKAILDEINNPHEISFLDCDTKDKEKIDKISFLPAGKAEFDISKGTIDQLSECWKSKGRQEMGVGRIVNKLFPDRFKNQEVEEFVNGFKAAIAKGHADFRLVQGEDIRKYYLEDNYEMKNKGDINASCMRYQKAQPWLDIFAKNPEKCKLLILMSDKDPTKIKGRALVWMGTRKPVGRTYMDRIYVIYDANEQLFMNYAIEHNWLYKAAQVIGDASYMDEGKKVYSSVAIQLNPIAFKNYPSLDTLSYYTPTTGRLGSNQGNPVPGHPRYNLNSADGGSTKIDK